MHELSPVAMISVKKPSVNSEETYICSPLLVTTKEHSESSHPSTHSNVILVPSGTMIVFLTSSGEYIVKYISSIPLSNDALISAPCHP